jgi:hypothetical protein
MSELLTPSKAVWSLAEVVCLKPLGECLEAMETTSRSLHNCAIRFGCPWLKLDE